MFLGIVDEYHGARYFSGVPARLRGDIASGSTIRPELAAYRMMEGDIGWPPSSTPARQVPFRE
jgi:hypothetical protein